LFSWFLQAGGGFVTYEGGQKNGQTIVGKMMWYGDSGGQYSNRPYYQVQLDNGVKVYVPAYGELSPLYRGPVVLTVMRGEVTGKTNYMIDVSQTQELHNNERQSDR
jgi:hypothetical protein